MKPTDLQSKVIAFMRFPNNIRFISRYRHGLWMVMYMAFYMLGFFILENAGHRHYHVIHTWLDEQIPFCEYFIVPYLLWNLLYLLLAIILGLFIGKVPILGIPFDDLTFTSSLKAFWNITLIPGSDTTIAAPIAIPFWFVRDLMVAMVCSPLIYFAVTWFIRLSGRRPLVRYIFFLVILFAIGYCPQVTGINPDGWLFFAYGAYFGIKKKEFIVAMLPYALPSFIMLAAIVGIEQLLPCEFIYRLEHVVGLIFIISLTTVMVRAGTWYVNMTLSNGSFFIFAFHYMLLGFIIWLYGTDTFIPHSAWLALLMYVLAVAVVVFFGLIFYWLMRTRLPFITYILMGGRR